MIEDRILSQALSQLVAEVHASPWSFCSTTITWPSRKDKFTKSGFTIWRESVDEFGVVEFWKIHGQGEGMIYFCTARSVSIDYSTFGNEFRTLRITHNTMNDEDLLLLKIT